MDDRGKEKPDVAGQETVRTPPPPSGRKNSLVERVEVLETRMDLMGRKVDRIHTILTDMLWC